MSHLVFKFERLKGVVKDWEKKQKFKRNSMLTDLDKEIHSLLTSCPSGVLSEDEAMSLSFLKGNKEKLLVHEVLTWKLKSIIIWIELGDANTKFFHSFASAP